VGLFNGPLMRHLRERKGWDQQTLASEAHVHPSVISRLERGSQQDVRLSVVAAIAATLEVSIDDLVREGRQHQSLEPSSPLIAELEILIRELGDKPIEVQRQIAGMIRGFLSALD
jgi:transcriptional regulator with XRE-family HTH domain